MAEEDLGVCRFSPSPGVLGRGASFWRVGWGSAALPLCGLTSSARPGLKVGGRWCFLHGVWAWAPLLREAMESALLGGQVEDSSGSTQKG